MGFIGLGKGVKSLLYACGMKHLPPRNYFVDVILQRHILPSYIRLELTHACNLSCAICPGFLHRPLPGKKEMATGEIKAVIDELGAFSPLPFVSVSGGEPFLRDDCVELLRYLESRHMPYKVLTNATVLLPRWQEEILCLSPRTFQISLDGPSGVHDGIRGVTGAFVKTIEAARFLKKHARFPLLFMCIINAANACHLEDVAEIAQETGVDLCFGHLSFIGPERFKQQSGVMKERFGIELEASRAYDCNDLHLLDSREVCRQIERIRKKHYSVKILFTQELPYEKIVCHYRDREGSVFNDRCYYPWYGLRIDPYGGLSLCKDDYLALGSVQEGPLAKTYNNPLAKKFRRYFRNNILPLCARCCWCGSGDSMTTVFGKSGQPL